MPSQEIGSYPALFCGGKVPFTPLMQISVPDEFFENARILRKASYCGALR